jgi:hypothetical protein
MEKEEKMPFSMEISRKRSPIIRPRQCKCMVLKTAITLSLFIALALCTPFAQAQEICYQIMVDDGTLDNTEEYHLQTLDEVAQNFKLHTSQSLDTTQLFVGADIYFQYRTKSKIYYCEKVKIVVNKKGEKAYRKFKRKELNQFASAETSNKMDDNKLTSFNDK